MKIFGFGILLLLSKVQAEVAPSPNMTIKVKAYNRVIEAKKTTTLVDIVDSESLNIEIKKKLESVTLGDAPKLGEQRIYSSKVIAEAVRQGHIKNNWNIQIPYRVIVENKGFDLDQELIERELLSRWKTLCANCEIRIKGLQMPIVPPALANRPWFVEVESRLPRGNFAQKLMITSEDGRSQIFWVNGQVEVRKSVPVLNRSTPMSTRITSDDFQFEIRDITYATDTTPSTAEIVGQQSKFTMNANDIIWRGSLVREKAVQRGEIVKVSVADTNANWEISVQARTEQDGYIGDTVNLRNLQSNRIITGKVIGSGEVEIR